MGSVLFRKRRRVTVWTNKPRHNVVRDATDLTLLRTARRASMYQNKRAAVKRARTGDAERATVFWGYVILICTVCSFVAFSYATIISKVLPETGYKFLDGIKYDHYYCWLIPTMIPVTYLFIYLNWMSLKFFRHN